jgi:hypothetical protein
VEAVEQKARPGDIVYLATDADCCRQAVERQYSGSAEFRADLRRIRAVGAHIRTTRVAGINNVADNTSRGRREIEEPRRVASWRALQELAARESQVSPVGRK